jgi:hypothetical protein
MAQPVNYDPNDLHRALAELHMENRGREQREDALLPELLRLRKENEAQAAEIASLGGRVERLVEEGKRLRSRKKRG